MAVLEHALSICNNKGFAPTGLAEVYYQAGLTRRVLGRSEEALADIRKSLEIRLGTRDTTGIADCLREISVLTADGGDFLFAHTFLDHALLLYDQSGNAGGRAAAVGVLGDLHARTGRTEDARACYEDALAFWAMQRHKGWSEQMSARLASLEKEGNCGTRANA
jgi:tetratricopeptide (TPR) repeat protein